MFVQKYSTETYRTQSQIKQNASIRKTIYEEAIERLLESVEDLDNQIGLAEQYYSFHSLKEEFRMESLSKK